VVRIQFKQLQGFEVLLFQIGMPLEKPCGAFGVLVGKIKINR